MILTSKFFFNIQTFSGTISINILHSTSLKNFTLFCPNNHTGTVLKIHTTKFGRLGVEGLVILAYPFISITIKDSEKVQKSNVLTKKILILQFSKIFSKKSSQTTFLRFSKLNFEGKMHSNQISIKFIVRT